MESSCIKIMVLFLEDLDEEWMLSKHLEEDSPLETIVDIGSVEINFPPVLDEHFSVNTSKQQIILTKDF